MEQREFRRWNYIAEVTQALLDNQTKHNGEGKYIGTSFYDYFNGIKKAPDKTADEILSDLINRGAMEVTSDG